MMNIVFYSILGLLVFMAAFCIYKLRRNDKVYKFRRWVADNLIFIDNDYHQRAKIFYRVSYKEMFKSFKPLKLESFFTVDEIKVLFNIEQEVQECDATEGDSSTEA